MELKRHASYWMNWKRWEHLNGRDRDWEDLTSFIGEMVAKYAEAMDLDNLPDPDFYLRRERIRQLYTELYKEKNITKFRNTKISIERKVAA